MGPRRQNKDFSRRSFLASSAAGLGLLSRSGKAAPFSESSAPVSPDERAFLEDFASRCVRYFWDQADGHTGIVMDRARNDGTRSGNNVGSSAATGFGLTALCIGASRGWLPRDQVRARVLTTLRYFWTHAFHDHGFYYHFMDARTGERRLGSEISSVDTAWLLCGVLTAAGYFSTDREIQTLAHQIFDRVD